MASSERAQRSTRSMLEEQVYNEKEEEDLGKAPLRKQALASKQNPLSSAADDSDLLGSLPAANSGSAAVINRFRIWPLWPDPKLRPKHDPELRPNTEASVIHRCFGNLPRLRCFTEASAFNRSRLFQI